MQEFTEYKHFVDSSGDHHSVDKVMGGYRVMCDEGCPCVIFVLQSMYGRMSGF